MKLKQHYSTILAIVLAGILCQNSAVAVTQNGALEGRSITGTVYFLSGRASGRSLSFKLTINRLTPPEEVKRLNVMLAEGGQDDLLKTLSKMDAGRIQIGSGVGLTANAIIAAPDGDRMKITVLYERYLGFGELRYGARSQDYRFGYAELYVGQGANEGTLIPAAKVRLRNGNTWEVEDFGTFPARLMGLQVRGKGRS